MMPRSNSAAARGCRRLLGAAVPVPLGAGAGYRAAALVQAKAAAAHAQRRHAIARLAATGGEHDSPRDTAATPAAALPPRPRPSPRWDRGGPRFHVSAAGSARTARVEGAPLFQGARCFGSHEANGLPHDVPAPPGILLAHPSGYAVHHY